MMNVNNMKGILGDAVSNEVRTLELRVGQVVRGVVLQQFPNNEATVSINGVQVRAKLEVPIMEGQASLLQVQPDSKGGQVHLKQVDPTALGLQDPMKDILKALSLPDKPWANELIKDLRKEGFALNKETAAAFQRAAQLMPAGVNQEQWMNAAAAAFKRGLPMSEATIAAIHQLQSGASTHQLLDQLRGQLATLAQSNTTSASNAFISQLVSLLDEGAELLRQLSGQAAGSGQLQQGNAAAVNSQTTAQQSSASIPMTAATMQLQQTAMLQSSETSQQSGVLQTNGQGAATQQQAAQGQSAAMHNEPLQVNSQGNGSNLLPQLMKWLGVNYEAMLGKQLMQQSTTATAQSGQIVQQPDGMSAQSQTLTQPGSVSLSAQQVSQQQVQQPLTNSAVQGTQHGAQHPAQPAGNQPGMMASTVQTAGAMQSMAGVELASHTAVQQGAQPTAQHLAGGGTQAPLQADQGGATSSPLPTQQAHSIASQPGTTHASVIGQHHEQSQIQQAALSSQQMAQHASHENLKSAILQLLGQPDVPGQVKETAQQLLHAITGQQLMLSAERNHSVFSHITMFIPIKDADNGQTASVHIQTRRDRRGELDSENCRIVFDLQMKSLGPTLVDMSIVNKIVSLNLWNDHPALAPIMEALKPEISEALYDHGYMLSSVRATPIPLKEEEAVKHEEGRQVIIPPDIDQLSSTRYKGVDFKV